METVAKLSDDEVKYVFEQNQRLQVITTALGDSNDNNNSSSNKLWADQRAILQTRLEAVFPEQFTQ